MIWYNIAVQKRREVSVTRYTVYKFEQEAIEGSLTYMDGLGFISANNRLRYLRSLKRSSAFLCFLALLYFLCRASLGTPILYIGYFFGMNIQINPTSGWINVAGPTAFFMALLVDFIALLLPVALASFVYRDQLYTHRMFAPARHNTARIAVPLLIACGLGGLLLTEGMHALARLLGLSLPAFVSTPSFLPTHLAPAYKLTSDLLTVILTTIFTHGIALRVLRRFGDGFAILSCALLSALITRDATAAFSIFLFSLAGGYFTIRGGSIRPVLFARIVCVLLFTYGNAFLPSLISSESLVEVIRVTTALLITAGAFFAYFHFIRMDANAFRLVHPTDALSNKKKLGNFCSSFFFFLLIFRLLVALAESVELMG